MNAIEAEAATKRQCPSGLDQKALRDCLLAYLRIANAELAVLQNELAFIGSALRNRLLTPHQAMQMAYERDVLDWLFQDKEGSA